MMSIKFPVRSLCLKSTMILEPGISYNDFFSLHQPANPSSLSSILSVQTGSTVFLSFMFHLGAKRDSLLFYIFAYCSLLYCIKPMVAALLSFKMVNNPLGASSASPVIDRCPDSVHHMRTMSLSILVRKLFLLLPYFL